MTLSELNIYLEWEPTSCIYTKSFIDNKFIFMALYIGSICTKRICIWIVPTYSYSRRSSRNNFPSKRSFISLIIQHLNQNYFNRRAQTGPSPARCNKSLTSVGEVLYLVVGIFCFVGIEHHLLLCHRHMIFLALLKTRSKIARKMFSNA